MVLRYPIYEVTYKTTWRISHKIILSARGESRIPPVLEGYLRNDHSISEEFRHAPSKIVDIKDLKCNATREEIIFIFPPTHLGIPGKYEPEKVTSPQ